MNVSLVLEYEKWTFEYEKLKEDIAFGKVPKILMLILSMNINKMKMKCI